ncbi:MAG: hypothetical protein A2W11_02805 [Ignavibacteria bacterium RBG_16_35_7]|nr:MAG: hypothetical protein A2W11_02805 [Ignavibacteria bacterium RBG_16_35_7]
MAQDSLNFSFPKKNIRFVDFCAGLSYINSPKINILLQDNNISPIQKNGLVAGFSYSPYIGDYFHLSWFSRIQDFHNKDSVTSVDYFEFNTGLVLHEYFNSTTSCLKNKIGISPFIGYQVGFSYIDIASKSSSTVSGIFQPDKLSSLYYSKPLHQVLTGLDIFYKYSDRKGIHYFGLRTMIDLGINNQKWRNIQLPEVRKYSISASVYWMIGVVPLK